MCEMASAATQLYENVATGSPGGGHGGERAEGVDEEQGTIELDAAEAQDTQPQENPGYRMLTKTGSLSIATGGISPFGSPLHGSPKQLSPHCSLRGSARGSPLGSPLPARDSPADEDPTASSRHNAMSFRGSPGRSRSPVRGREPMYVTKWCSDHAGVGFQFNDSQNLVTYAGVRGLHLYVPRIFFCSLVLGCLSVQVRSLGRSGAGPQGLQSSDSDSKCRAVVCRDHAEMRAKHARRQPTR